MSDASSSPSSARERSFGRRLRRTPFRDLVRGRVTGRLDLDAVFEEATLPPSIESLVRRVARRARLDRLERVDVARDLAEHFRDGLADGSDPDTLIHAFGDDRAAARLIRRSMLRKRSLVRRVNRRFLQVILITFAAMIGIYLLAAVRYWSQRPIVSTDYIAQLNVPIRSLSPAERSWPRIRAAMIELRGLVEPDLSAPNDRPEVLARADSINVLVDAAQSAAIESWHGQDPHAEIERLDEATPSSEAIDAFFAASDTALETLRSAAALPSLGRELGAGPPSDPEDVAFFGLESRPPADPAGTLAGSVIAIELPEYMTLRSAARVLGAEARRAVVAGDGARAVADIDAIFGIARQTREPSFLIGQLVAIAIEQLGFDVVLDALAAHPDAFTDDDLSMLATVVANLDDDGLAMDLSSERLLFLDLAQRFYTDDGSGNGVLTLRAAEGMGQMGAGTGIPEAPSVVGFLVAPGLANLALDRASAVRVWNDFFDACEGLASVEPWSLDRRELEIVDGRPMSETMDGWRNRLRYFPLNLLIPAINKSILAGLAVRSERDLVATVVALERTRRRTGDWPSGLDAIPSDLLDQVVRDPFDGEPLRYAVSDSVPTFWTIGPDRDDDDGRAVEDRRDPSRGVQRIASPASLASTSSFWGAGEPAETDLDGDIVVWRGPDPDPATFSRRDAAEAGD